MTRPSPAMKTCTKCGEMLPATTEYFYRNKRLKSGLWAKCKQCVAERMRDYQQANKERIVDYQRDHYQVNKERLSKQKLDYYYANKERIAEQRRDHYQVNKERIAERHRDYYHANKEQDRISSQRRRAHKLKLPATFTTKEWFRCLDYFNYCCAVCGNQLRDLFGDIVPHRDHWMPLSSDECTGTIASNMICLCNKCNLSKHAKLPDIWLQETYGARKAKIILKRIDDYFELVKDSA